MGGVRRRALRLRSPTRDPSRRRRPRPRKSFPSVIGNRDAPMRDSSLGHRPAARRTSIKLTEAASTATSISVWTKAPGAGLREYIEGACSSGPRQASQPVGWARLPFPASSPDVRPTGKAYRSRASFIFLGRRQSPDDRPCRPTLGSGDRPETDMSAAPTRPASARTVSSISRSGGDGGQVTLAAAGGRGGGKKRRLEQFPDGRRRQRRGDLGSASGIAARSGMVRAACSSSSCSVTSSRARLQLNVGDRHLAGVGVRTSRIAAAMATPGWLARALLRWSLGSILCPPG